MTLSRTYWILTATLAFLLNGCALLQTIPSLTPAKAAENSSANEQAAVQTATPAHVVVQLHGVQRSLGEVKIPYQPGLLVENLVQQSGASGRFARMTIKLYRPSGAAGAYHPLEAEYDHVKQRVRAESNYSVRPGDYLVVNEDPTTAFDDMFAELLGPLSGFVQ